MASDGDMFAQRKAWGFNRLCAAACDRESAQRLAEIETQCVRNMLGNGYAVPALGLAVKAAYEVIKSVRTDLPMESRAQRETRLTESVRKVERKFLEAPSSADIGKVVISVGLRALGNGQEITAFAEFRKDCCQALASHWLRRYGWDLFRPYVMRHGQVASAAYEEMTSKACDWALPAVSDLIQSAMSSPGGRLVKRKVSHTAEGLAEVLQ